MSSVSSTSSLGNTALRGFGGLASGIDRDSLIEQMTAGTTSKITAKKQAMTKLEWKRDAYRSISNKILDLQDTYLSYSGTKSLKNSDFFAKNLVTVHGDSDYTKYLSASGNSDTASRVSVLGVSQLATSASLISGPKNTDDKITLGGITESKFNSNDQTIKTSNLSGKKLTFGTYDLANQKFTSEATFTFPSSYTKTNSDGTTETVQIDYTADPEKVKDQLNEALNSQGFLGKEGKSGIQFKLNNGHLEIERTSDITENGKNYVISGSSSALESLGFQSKDVTTDDGISLDEFNKHTSSFQDASVTSQTLSGYLKGKSISVSYGGQTKTISLIDDKETISDFSQLQNSLQKKLDKAFGTKKVTVGKDNNGVLTFAPEKDEEGKSQTLQISADTTELRNALGITSTQANKVSTGKPDKAGTDGVQHQRRTQ